MYALPKNNYLKRSLLVNDRGQVYAMDSDPIGHGERIREELQAAGLSKQALSSMECRYLPHIIHGDEHIGGAIYGWQAGNLAILVATNRRIIFLDKKPLFINKEEVSYFVVSGVTANHSLVGSELILHTRIKDYILHTFNKKSVQHFVDFIESHSLENLKAEEQNDYIAQNRLVQAN